MFRFLSVQQRKRRLKKDEKQSLSLFFRYAEAIKALPPHEADTKKLLIIRLDDIGDYLLFRNTLRAYKQSPQWQGYSITLLGNTAWKELFFLFDEHTADETIWINKGEYLRNDDYKKELWLQIRTAGYEVVICPSATRPVLLDDLCRLAAGSQRAFGFSNLTPHKAWKEASDPLYTDLFLPQPLTHEFFLNQQFANWCCSTALNEKRPSVPVERHVENYIVCFTGASTRSKKWPVKRWIQLIQLINQHHTLPIKIIGVGNDKTAAETIAAAAGGEAVTNTTLADVVNLVSHAKAVITNDTMAAHLAVSTKAPVVILANGGNVFTRFTHYETTAMEDVVTLYPQRFCKIKQQKGDAAMYHHIAATADIATIKAHTVFDAVKKWL